VPRPATRRLAPALVLAAACGGGASPDPEQGSGPQDDAAPPPGPAVVEPRASLHEVEPPYLDEPGFWERDDFYVLRPGVEPLDRRPDEVLDPTAHGVRIVVFLPGDYRARSNGALPPGVLYVPASGTEDEPLLFTYAPFEGADILAAPHTAERIGASEARLISIRIWNETHQYFHGLTFRNGTSSCLMRRTSGSVIDRCLWHETSPQPLRIRFDAHHNVVQRCVFQRFEPALWGSGDTVAIQASDDACTHNRIVSNVVLNYTDSYQHTDRDGDAYGLGAGTILDNNFMGFTEEAFVQDDAGELLCGENSLDFKMGGTEAEPVLVTNNVFFGARAAKKGCAASGSGGYAITLQRRGTWIELRGNVFLDCDAGVFLNSIFQDTDPALGRIDPHHTIAGNVFSGIRSFATTFPDRTGRVLSGLGPAVFRDNRIVACERLMEREPPPNVGDLLIEDNTIHGPLELAPRERAQLEADGNIFREDAGETVLLRIPWVGRTLEYRGPP